MENSQPEWVGKSCGQHGPYTFFKTFRYSRNNKWKMLSLGDFFFVRCSENEPLCIAELQLLWETKNAEGIKLSSSRLYFLPECTPEGRMEWHGEDEVLAVRGKVVLKVEDLEDWIVTDVEWSHGGPTIWKGDILPQVECLGKVEQNSVTERKEDNQGDKDKSQVIILSYNRYCRHKAILKRLESTGQQWMSCPEVQAMGLLLVPHKGTRMFFCREEFEHPSLADNEQLCDHLAPKLKGRPRKKRTSVTEQEAGNEDKQAAKVVHMTRATVKKEKELQPLRRTRRKRGKIGYQRKKAASKEEADFLERLYKFMQERSTPIERLPCLGFKQINLFLFFKTTQQFGGYDIITSQRLWKKVYIELGGNPGCTSAATCTRRLYERYIQPFVTHLSGNKTSKVEKPKLKKRKKTKRKQLPTEEKDKEVEKEIRPRKRVKKVREHLEEIKRMQAEKQAEQNGVHLIQVHDLSTVHPASLPGHTLDANFNIEKKDTLTSMGTSSISLPGLYTSHVLKPEDLRHKLNSKQQRRAKALSTRHVVTQEMAKDVPFQTVESFAEKTGDKSSSPSMVSRPSVIQHTHRPQKMLSAEQNMKLHHHQAIQPSDLILRNMAQHLEKGSDSKKGSKPSTDMQVNNFPRPLVFPPTVPFMRPFVPYMNPMFMRGAVPMMAFHPKLPGQGSNTGQVTHSNYTSNLAEDLQAPKSTRAHQVPVIQPSSAGLGLAEQEEPCDLSLPKKRKEEIQPEEPKVKREKLPFGNLSVETSRNGMKQHLVNQRAAHDHNLQRLAAMNNPLGQSVVRAAEDEKHRNSPVKRVKMTPPSRGSITQGVINTQQPTSSRESVVKQENASTPESATTDIKPIPVVYPNMSGFMAATRGMSPFPFMPQFFRPGFPPMVQTPSGFLPQTPFLPPHSPLLGSTVPTSLALNQDAMLPRGVIVPGPLAFASSVYRTPVPSMATDKQPAS